MLGGVNWREYFRCRTFVWSISVMLHVIIKLVVSPVAIVKEGRPERREKSAEDQRVMGLPSAWGQIWTSVRGGVSLE